MNQIINEYPPGISTRGRPAKQPRPPLRPKYGRSQWCPAWSYQNLNIRNCVICASACFVFYCWSWIT